MRERLSHLKGQTSTDRAQTEILGFAMLFGTILLVILLVIASASGGLLSVREDRKVANAEVAMVAFADNVDDLNRGEAPSRSTGFDLDGGRLSLGSPATLTVSGTNGAGPDFSETVKLRPLVYRAPDGTELVYLDGMVIRDDGHGAATIDGPAQSVSTDRVMLTLVRFEAADRTDAVGGDSVVSVSTVRTDSTVVASGGSYDLTLELTSPQAAAWARTLDAEDGVSCPEPTGTTATCTVSTDRVGVAIVDVEVRFD